MTPKVKQETRELVLNRAKEMGYKPNNLAKGLRGTFTHTVGIILNDVENPAMNYVFKRISVEMSKFGYSTLVSDSLYDEAVERRNIETVLSHFPECVILFPVSASEKNLSLFDSKKDSLIVIGDAAPADISSVSIDYALGGYLSAKALLEKGHRDIAVFAEPESFPISNKYIEGIRKAFSEFGAVLDDEAVFHMEPSIDNGCKMFIDLQEQKGRGRQITGILCFCDSIAHGVYRACHIAGLSIPGDISVIGFDDNPLSAYSNPPLTTVYLPKERLLECCLEILNVKLSQSNSGASKYIITPHWSKGSQSNC